MSPTVWVIVATIYMPDGSKQVYRPEVEFPDSTSCFASAEPRNREWLEQRRGWVMCVPKEFAK